MLPIRDVTDFLLDNQIIILGLVVANYALAVACAIRELMISRTSQGSIAWLLSLLLLPFPTTLFYLAFGWKLIDSLAARQAAAGRAQRVARAHDLSLLDDEAISAWPALTAVSQLPFLSGNAAKLLIDGTATFESIFEGIARAKHTVFAQFFIIRADRLGNELADRLIERARAGVAVYLLYDDFGSFFLPRSYVRRLRAAGVRVSSFNHQHKLLRLYGPMRLNYRNHRKMVVVDGTDAWVGGQNVGIEYLGESKRFGRWRDTQVNISGPAATSCSLVFREDWHWATGEVIAPPLKTAEAVGEQTILVMPSGPADKLEECAIAFSEVIGRARRRVWIVSPYFVPDVDMQTALYAAALRGVDVRILIPRKPDHLLVWLASNTHASHMIDHGVSVYRYNAGFLHQKVILMDDEIAGVGTVNFDNRSFSINFEITLWFTHPQMIADVNAMLTQDFADSKPFTVGDRDRIPFAVRFAGYGARLLSPLL